MMEKAPKAYKNKEFITGPNAQGIRILAEYLEPKYRFIEANVHKAIICYGSARLVSSKDAKKLQAEAKTNTERQKADRLFAMAKYYDGAEELCAKIATWTLQTHKKEDLYRICSGGGPGIMEAVNKGVASVSRDLSIGLNISLPFEQEPNDYISEQLNFEFHYFFMRKFWFMKLAEALVIFPGGFGTFDELFETLTLIQTGKKKPMPIILFGESFWKSIINFDTFVESQIISEKDLQLFHFVETADEAFKILTQELS
jgi:hypothetical protein